MFASFQAKRHQNYIEWYSICKLKDGQRPCIFDPNKPEKEPTAREVRAKKRKLLDPEPSEENSDTVEEISETVEEILNGVRERMC